MGTTTQRSISLWVLLMVTAGIHVLFGLSSSVYRKDWKETIRHGLWNTVSITDDRKMAAFWFVISGFIMFVSGIALFEVEKLCRH